MNSTSDLVDLNVEEAIENIFILGKGVIKTVERLKC